MGKTSLSTRVVVFLVCAVSAWLPPVAAASRKPLVMYAADGRVLYSKGPLLWLDERGTRVPDASLAFRLELVTAPDADVWDGDTIWVRSNDGRYLTHWGEYLILTQRQQLATRWQVARANGAGLLEVGDAFSLRTGDLELSEQHGSLAVLPERAGSATWSFGCYFEPGPFSERWSDSARFEVATGERGSAVARAVAWLQGNIRTLRMPAGDLPMITWDDPTLQPAPTVSYVITDSLWAAKALAPYDPDLAEAMQLGLVRAGWFGNGLHDTLFHPVDALAHRPASDDFVHGTLLDRCSLIGAASAERTQLRVPELAPDQAWTDGNSTQFIDSAVYTALDEFWHGEVEQARARVREMIVDSRSAGFDTMFWDSERWISVDQAARCDYDAYVGACSPQCPGCTICEGAACIAYNASYKLGLLLYAGRVTGVASEPQLVAQFDAIEHRLWEGQRDDGGLPHVVFYGPNAALIAKSGATGEATSIAVLSQSLIATGL